jgi:hypothetical protein
MAALDAMDRDRKSANKHMLNSDFKDKNAELSKIMKERAKLLLEDKKKETSNYFPFIGSD